MNLTDYKNVDTCPRYGTVVKKYIDMVIKEAAHLRIGKGHGPLNHLMNA